MGKVKLVIFSGFPTKVAPVITHRNDARDLFSSLLLVRHTFIKYSVGDSSPKESQKSGHEYFLGLNNVITLR